MEGDCHQRSRFLPKCIYVNGGALLGLYIIHTYSQLRNQYQVGWLGQEKRIGAMLVPRTAIEEVKNWYQFGWVRRGKRSFDCKFGSGSWS